MARGAVLVVEDEEDILELVRINFSSKGFNVSCATSGEEGVQLAKTTAPSLLMLDLMLPGMDGLDVCRTLKSDPETSAIPIVMISARGSDADIITELELGADDYVTKPFSPKVMVARAEAVIRRRFESAEDTLAVGPLTIDAKRFEVLVSGEKVALTIGEFRILHFLAQREGSVFTRHQIVTAVRGDNYFVSDRAVDVQIVGLRKKLGLVGHYIDTVRGIGYRFQSNA